MSRDMRPIAEALVRHLASAPSAQLVDATRVNLTRLVGSATRLPAGFEEVLLGEIAVTLPVCGPWSRRTGRWSTRTLSRG